MPLNEVGKEFLKELALALCSRGVLSLGKARILARMTRWEFEELLGQRKIIRHYTKQTWKKTFNMPLVITDSSTLIHLASIGQLHLLKDFYETITIPPAIWTEVVTEGKGDTLCALLFAP